MHEDTEAKVFNVRDVGHRMTIVSLVFLPFEFMCDTLVLLHSIILLCAQ